MKRLVISSTLIVSVFLSILIFPIGSCSKENTPANTAGAYPIEGLWIGTYKVDGRTDFGEQYFSFAIKPDGTMVADTKGANVQHLSTGTWTLNGTTLACTFTCVYGISFNVGIVENTTATWDKAGKLTGTWKNVAPLTGSGTFTLTRVN